MKKKILFISQNLPPYLYPQSIQIGRFLQDIKGHFDTYILCADENMARDETLYPRLYEGIPKDHILRVPFRHNRIWNEIQNRLLPFLYKRPDLHKAWSDQAYDACLQKFGQIKFDAIITFSFPLSLNLLGARLKDHYHCRWVAHQSDPWVDNPAMHYGPLTRLINQKMEREYFQKADRLVFTNEEAADFYRTKYPELQDRIDFVDHSFDPALYPAVKPWASARKTIRYVGNFYGRRTIAPLLEALNLLKSETREKLQFEIVGANLKTRLMIQKSKLPPTLLRATERVNYVESLKLMAESDFLLVIDAPVKKSILFLSKLVDYIGSGRPVIGISSPGPTERILKSLNYPCFRHDQVTELVAAFENIAAGHYQTAFDADGVRQNYLNSVNAAKLAGIIDRA